MAAGDLRTLSLASGRMEEQFAQGNLTRIFYRNQSELLLEKVDDTANQLSATSELEEVHQRISDIAARLKGMLEKAQLGDTVEARELNELGLEAKNIEDSLKER